MKIQFDTVSGVVQVLSFDTEAEIIQESYVFEFLKEAKDGIIYGCEVSAKTAQKIEKEYGIRNPASSAAAALGRIKTAKKAEAARENGKKGGRPSKITVELIQGQKQLGRDAEGQAYIRTRSTVTGKWSTWRKASCNPV